MPFVPTSVASMLGSRGLTPDNGPVADPTEPAVPHRADPARSIRARGFTLALGAAFCWSLAGLLVRLVEEGTSWHIILYRSLGVTLTLGAIIAVVHRGRVAESIRLAGWPAIVAGLCATASSVLFILALARVTVANALFMLGITPFLAAIGSQALLGERVPRRAWGAMALAAAGVAVMLGSGLALGQLGGNLLALGSAASFAANALLLRSNRQTDMLPAVLYAGIFGTVSALMALGVLDLSPLVPLRDLALGLAMGAVQLSLGLVLYTRASRDLPAAELQLVATAELVLAPLWVWIGMGETPNAATLVGGALIILAILAQALGGGARELER
jgi:drug/metabolite transporter (DMT)-like permease